MTQNVKYFIIFRDDVKWDEDQEKNAIEIVQKNSSLIMSQEQIQKHESKAESHWNAFYDIHQNKFFKDRHWLFTEFPELQTSSNIFEIGCGVGNTILPILKYNKDCRVFGCDFSSRAVQILKENDEFDEKRCQVFILDVTNENWHENLSFGENSMDIIVIIFVLSAVKPEK